MSRIIIALLMVILFASCKQHPVADQVVFGKVWTGDEQTPWAEAFAIVGDSIVAVGSAKEIEKWMGEQTKQTHHQTILSYPALLIVTHILWKGALPWHRCNCAMQKRHRNLSTGLKPSQPHNQREHGSLLVIGIMKTGVENCHHEIGLILLLNIIRFGSTDWMDTCAWQILPH